MTVDDDKRRGFIHTGIDTPKHLRSALRDVNVYPLLSIKTSIENLAK